MFKKVLSLFFSVLLLFSFVASCQSVKSVGAVKNKAIIVVPGTYASGLFYRGKTCTKYYKNEALWMPLDDNGKWRMIKGIAKFVLFNRDLFCDENGNPINRNVGLFLKNKKFPYKADKNIVKYGVGDSCKKLINALNKRFKNYKVFLYNYDWRLGVDKAAESLTKEIQKYDEVVLVGHSLGGMVSCRSAVQLKKLGQLEKVKKYISIGVPYNGTTEAFYVLNKGMTTENDFMGMIIRLLGIQNIIKNIAQNCSTTYYLLPSKAYFGRLKKGYIIDAKGKNLDYNETLEFLKTRDFAKKSNGYTKRFLNEQEKVYDSLIVDGKHILNFLDYHMIVGCGLDTMSEFSLSSEKPNEIKIIKYVDGDGSIALNESAIPFDGIEKNRIFKVKGRHQFLISDDRVVENIVNTIGRSVLGHDKELAMAA